MTENNKTLVEVIASMDEEEAVRLTKELLEGGTTATAILDDCRAAMDIIGGKFEAGEYYVPELILAGEMLEQISAIVKPL